MNELITTADLPVTISGEWLDPPKRDWRGIASASEPLVAVVFLKQRNRLEWCKSDRGSVEGLPIRLALFPYDKLASEVQVNFSVGGGGRCLASNVPSRNYRPDIHSHNVVRTGELVTFARVDGSPAVDAEMLFIPQRSVQFGRNALWRLRSGLELSLPDELNQILIGKRSRWLVR